MITIYLIFEHKTPCLVRDVYTSLVLSTKITAPKSSKPLSDWEKKCDFIYIAASPEHKHLHKLFCKLCIENITPGIIGMLFQNCPIFTMILCSKYYTVLLHLEGTW